MKDGNCSGTGVGVGLKQRSLVHLEKPELYSPLLPSHKTATRGRVSGPPGRASDNPEGPPKVCPTSFRTTGDGVPLTFKGHNGVLPPGAQLLLTAGLAGDILGTGDVGQQQGETG